MDVFTTSPRVVTCRSLQIGFKTQRQGNTFCAALKDHIALIEKQGALSACAASLPLLRKYTSSLRLKSCCYSSSFDKSLTAPLSALLASSA